MGTPLTRRQREILDYLEEFIARNGYAPSLEEIAAKFDLSSLATVHKHLQNLEEKGYVKRDWNKSRALELLGGERPAPAALHLPLLGRVAAGLPIEAIEDRETLAVPEEFVGSRRGETFVLQVRGDSMIDEHIRDGDYVIVEKRDTARDGEMVVALVDGDSATLKTLYREGSQVRLQPANPTMEPIVVDANAVRVQGIVIGVMRKY